jgi:hypothetical protein
VSNGKTRKLIHIPIVHSLTEMGKAKELVRETYLSKTGELAWKESRAALKDFWQAVEVGVNGMHLDWARVRLYQDGLPVCGFEEKIVHDLASQGIVNYRLLLQLSARGAKIEGTEDAALLRDEYELILSGLPDKVSAVSAQADRAVRLKRLLNKRDRFIAQRIDQTLLPGETGILFLGALHRATEYLAGSSIRLVSLADSLRLNSR